MAKKKSGASQEKGTTPAAPHVSHARPSALLDARVVYCGDNLERLQKLPDARHHALPFPEP